MALKPDPPRWFMVLMGGIIALVVTLGTILMAVFGLG